MKKLIFIFSVIFAFVSCNEEQLPIEESNEIHFNFGIATKVVGSAFGANDNVSLFAVEYANSTEMPLQVGGNYINNEKLTFNGSTWESTRSLYWSDNACDFYAFYPFQPSIGSIERYPFCVAVNQNGDGYEASDLLYAVAKNVSRNGNPATPVSMCFNHMMSKIVVILEKGPNFEGDIPDDVVAHIYNTITSCHVDWSKGSVEKDAFGSKNTITMKKISNSEFEAVLVPQNIEKRTPLIELTMGGIAYLLEYSLSFRPGYVHTVTVTLNTSPDQEQIEISIDPSVNDWN